MRSVKFSNSDTMELVAIIKEKDHVCVDAFMEPSGIWLRSPNEETELRLLTLGDFQVTVSRVCFSHKRAGCMTAIFGWLKKILQKKRYSSYCHSVRGDERNVKLVHKERLSA